MRPNLLTALPALSKHERGVEDDDEHEDEYD
jgi:hypothetical protein